MAPVNPKDAAWLLAEKYHGLESDEYRADLSRLEVGEPLDYVIGWTPFLGCHITLNSRPLIPRTETEYWVDCAISNWKRRSQTTDPLLVLDMFAGSGCVGVAFAHHIPTSLVDFAEKEARHLATIKKNCEINAVSDDRMRLFQSNIFSDIPDGSTYDLILANPPYIDSEAPQSVASSVLGHEPHDALFSTGAGLDLIRSLLDTAPQYMRSGSEIWIEHGPTQAAQVRHLAEQCGFSARTMSDQYERDRVMIGILK